MPYPHLRKAIAIVFVAYLLGQQNSLAHEGHTRGGHVHHHHGEHHHTQLPDEKNDTSSATSQNDLISLSGPSLAAFQPFAATVSASVVGEFLVLESNGLPNHQMMVGIRSWQQQVPLPQPFTGDNAWRLPLNPQFSDQPISVLQEPLRGAIALAVNGVPIFPALNNRGDDAYLAGELDHWGGHCGRGDDYHYHIAPIHLEKLVGVGNPIGYALDGFPILGLTEAEGSPPKDLDEFNGHKDQQGNYHYHASKTFPYVNGGLMGVVTMDGDQIRQPRDSPLRPGQSPLKGATVTSFENKGNDFDLEYEIDGRSGHVRYSILDDEQVEFSFSEPSGRTSKTVYRRGQIQAGQSITKYLILLLIVAGLCAIVVGLRSRASKRVD